ncbi:hypothetical protein K5M76_09550 [Shewanella xiamenensis]|uniref:hypothetical protein n=1 Tax=Shewanella xiamenensis TaxID=332186 RepID=UPI00217DC170|nr:hypothetical protein [Shewanella xiamenensis]MCT8857547.1 hypothetical protein [Shewanella xiamenensis]UWG66434.1 hypothetical protein K5M76_09550 [Shewanella xiamenensis]
MLNVNSESWQAVKKRLLKDREELLESLINDMSETATAKIRGKIEMIDEIIRLYPNDLKKQAQAADE